MIVILASIISGALYIQFFIKEEPCCLCLLQRLGMIGVATGALMNIRFGIRSSHYGISIISAIFGGFTALRQIALHVCPGFPTFGSPVLGLNLYTWSFIVFATSICYMALLMIIFDGRRKEDHAKNNLWGYFAFIFIFLIALINFVATLFECGLGPCPG